ncbi:MAG: serine/threonine-protein phosphatase [Candidatus Kapabacteria bacterium]|nr:serine/threonine-protein phosphatase [Candidatus Kapabacteria bacterium]
MSGRYQRSTYKLIDHLLSQTHATPLDMLRSLVHDIVEDDRFVVTGGRIWELDPVDEIYTLRHQEGEVEFLSEGTRRSTTDIPALSMLATTRTVVVDAKTEAGHARTYSMVGVGDLQRRQQGRLFQYALAFTAKEHSDEFTDTLVVVGGVATTALRTMQATQREHRLRRDLDQAWEIQRGLVPDHATTFREYDVYGISSPDAVVGGDYFDYLASPGDDERLSIVVSDAASKGMPAAVQALFVSGAMRMGAGFNIKMSSLVGRLNDLIYDTFPLERFVSLFLCELTSSSNGLVLYVNAGHCPPLHYSAADGTCRGLQPTGGILGIVEEQKFHVENINMDHGDVLLLFTDGISEAQDVHGTIFGEARLRTFLAEHHQSDARQIALALMDDVVTFSAGARYTDDRTVVVIRRR